MKHFNIGCLSAFLIVTGVYQASAQRRAPGSWQIGFGAGYTNYSGDVSNYRIRGFRDIGKLYRFADYNTYYIDRPSFSAMVHKNITPTLGFMIQANTLSFSASDRYRNKNGSLKTSSLYYSRSLNFRTSLQDAGIAFTFRSNNGKFLPENAFFYPSFFLGAGVSAFTVKGDLYDENNNRYNYTLPGNIQDGVFETNLRDLRTETDEKYGNVEAYADLGLALNFRFSDLVTFSLQSDIKYSASDYLDDVSGTYKAVYATPEEQYAAKPGYNFVNQSTLQRGDNNGTNDFYINNRLMLSIGLGRKKARKTFVAPAVYSLSAPYIQQDAKVDTLKKMNAYRDSLAAVRTDSLLLLIHKNDSLTRMIDTVRTLGQPASVRQNDSLRNELRGIRSELAEIRILLKDQQVRPRYQQLQYQADSLKNLRNRISTQRVISSEDRLQMRIYQLQADSVNNEIEKLQRQGQLPSTYEPASDVNTRAVTPQQVNTARSIVPTDTVRVTEIRTYNDEVNNLKQDKRYVSDQAFRQSVDSLSTRLSVYDQQMKAAGQITVPVNRQVVVKDTVINVTGQRKIDSLQTGYNELQRRLDAAGRADTSTYNQMREEAERRIAYNRSVDSEAVNRSINELDQRLRISNDSVLYLKRQLQIAADSATYYNNLASTLNEDSINSDSRNLKWYQRMFQSQKSKDKAASETTAERGRLSGQETYYRQQSDRTNRLIEDLEKRNSSLSDEYESLLSGRNRRRAEDIFVPATPPAVVYQNDRYRETTYDNRNYNELLSLRAEIDRLRNQVNDANQRSYDNYPVTGQPLVTVPVPSVLQPPVPAIPVVQDTANIQLLRSDLDQLRSQLDSLKNIKPVVTTREVVTNRKFDVRSFPVVSVYFSSGSAVLTNDQIRKMTSFAKVAAENPEANIRLKGFTDPTGNPAVNQAIAKKRSAFVRNLLTTRYNIADDRIADDEPFITEAGKNRKPNPLDRRVDLEFNQ